MSQNPNATIRTSQRAPRSCTTCYSRKVKCDKGLPCGSCIRRGQPEACVREVVIVRGEVTTFRDAPGLPTYEELRRDNERLERNIEALKARHVDSPRLLVSSEPCHQFTAMALRRSPRVRWCDQDDEGLEQRLWDALAADSSTNTSTVSSWTDIVLPSQACNDYLIAYDEQWNSWIHYALEYPTFRHECDNFRGALASNIFLEQMDSAWLALYFSVLSAALLMMDDDEAAKLTLREPAEHHMLSKNWYDAAVFCLHRANFMKVPSTRAVQAIAVLGICFNSVGDSELCQHLWGCAIRIAQRIGLDTPYSKIAGEFLSGEAQHRLWWTLVICDWLTIPYHPPAVDEIDFDVPYPEAPHSSTTAVTGFDLEHPVHYHVFMARIATVFYRFRETIRSEVDSLESSCRAVRAANEDLAGIITTLPAHLQPDVAAGGDQEKFRRIGQDKPWVKWQRFDLTLELLHLRIRIHRTLQNQWLLPSGQSQFDWARRISVESCISVIWINDNWDQPASMRQHWALSYHIFTAALLLLRECRDGDDKREKGHSEVIQAALKLLDEVKSRNALAQYASSIVREKLESIRLA